MRRTQIQPSQTIQHDEVLNERTGPIKHIGNFREATFAEIFFEKPFLRIDPHCTVSEAESPENLLYCCIAGSSTNFALK
ncbi:hypothetical protein TNCV_2991301 [Trichonephila clavipes]|uniref:Uncharacterized protein n=1 Tax=Trichonephila clavipes TaxID=2585209 RepID=A0A8X6S881_TRICX|nr:hypothetical protein TNCV_2991301 [Trichonephila clavipes]